MWWRVWLPLHNRLKCTKFGIRILFCTITSRDQGIGLLNFENVVAPLVWSSNGSLKVTGNSIIRYSAYEFLLAFHRNYNISILHRFWDIARQWSKIADFNLPHLYLAPLLGWPRQNFASICREKTRVPELSRVVVCVILRLAVLVQSRLVTDRRTDRQTQYNSIA